MHHAPDTYNPVATYLGAHAAVMKHTILACVRAISTATPMSSTLVQVLACYRAAAQQQLSQSAQLKQPAEWLAPVQRFTVFKFGITQHCNDHDDDDDDENDDGMMGGRLRIGGCVLSPYANVRWVIRGR